MKDLNNIQQALDALALALPKGFHWPKPLRLASERACRSVSRIEARTKHKTACWVSQVYNGLLICHRVAKETGC
jgi:hypothetical protein